MSDETTLLPCPFCGGEAKTRLNDRWWVHCGNCTCEIGFEGMDENGYYGHFDTEAEAIAAWNTRAELGSGMLTAEQVREAIMSADRWEKPMGNTGLTNTHLIIRDDGWQAIADELNAELGSGTCENVSDPPEGFLCSACGWGDFAEPSHLLTTAKYAGRVEGGPNYCPNCGRKVVGAC